jgi:hypothetical protein
MWFRSPLAVVVAAAFAAVAPAAPLTFTSPVVADYEFSIVGGTPLNPGPTTPFIPFRAVGNLTFHLSPTLNDPSQPTSVPFTGLSGVLQGVPPSPDFTLPHTISPNVEFLGGTLTNIVRDANGEVISADVVGLNARWELVGQSAAFPVRLYTQDGLPFDASGVTLPFAAGTVLRGPVAFNVYLDDGDGDPSNDVLAAVGRNRTLTVTPEPASAVAFGLLLTGGAVAVVRRRKPATN